MSSTSIIIMIAVMITARMRIVDYITYIIEIIILMIIIIVKTIAILKISIIIRTMIVTT
jgi:hypothetical protein